MRYDSPTCAFQFFHTWGRLKFIVESQTVIDNITFENQWVRAINLQKLLKNGCDPNINHIVIQLYNDEFDYWNIDWQFWVHDRYGNEYPTNSDKASGTNKGLVYSWDHHICWSNTANVIDIDLSKESKK